MKFYEVRCPFDKKHIIRGVEYDTCGTLLGAISEDSEAYFRCPTCGLVLVSFRGTDVPRYSLIGKRKIHFDKTWREVDNE